MARSFVVFPLYMDQDSMEAAVVSGRRVNGVDLLTTAEAGRLRQSDESQLAFATKSGRVVVTANIGDFRRLHVAGSRHAGIVGRPNQGMTVDGQIRALLNILQGRSAEEMEGNFEFLSNWL